MRERLYVQQQGQCAMCGSMVLFGSKTFIRDHTQPLAEGGADVVSNTAGICASCSEAKTKTE